VPLYGYVSLDERLIYYARRDIPLLNDASLRQLRAAHTPLLLLVEGAKAADLKAKADCQIREFTPYLSKNKTLAVYGFGAACVSTRTGSTAG
jgi:hypothetical protein